MSVKLRVNASIEDIHIIYYLHRDFSTQTRRMTLSFIPGIQPHCTQTVWQAIQQHEERMPLTLKFDEFG